MIHAHQTILMKVGIFQSPQTLPGRAVSGRWKSQVFGGFLRKST
jgi:hypothetical protein